MAGPSDVLVQELLKGRYIGTLATDNADGTIHQTAVWYLFDQGRVYVATASSSRKARNVRERSKVSLMIDVRQAGMERGVSLAGRAEVLTGTRSREINQRIQQRYLSPQGMADPRVGGMLAKFDDVTIELTPARWISWDMRELGKTLFGGAPITDYFLPLD